MVQAPNWAAVVLGELGMTAVHSRILEWHMVAAAAVAAAGMAVGCSGHLMMVVVVPKRGGWHMAEKEEQNLHCMRRVLHDAERGGAAAADGGCSGSS